MSIFATGNTTQFLEAVGYLGLFLIIFAETGILIGVFFPGESLLLSAGLLSSLGYFDIRLVIPIVIVAAVLADSAGYAVGKKYGSKIFHRKNSLLFDQRYIAQSEKFYKDHGGKTVIIARFLPFIRTIAPILAGVGRMRYPVFLVYNFVGAILWSVVISLFGFYLGQQIPDADQHILLLIVIIVFICFAPTALALVRDKDSRKKLMNFLRERTNW